MDVNNLKTELKKMADLQAKAADDLYQQFKTSGDANTAANAVAAARDAGQLYLSLILRSES